MKASPEQRAALAAAIHPLDITEHREAYRSGRIPRADQIKDLDARYRWDLLWASRFDIAALYAAGLNDDHIDTALRAIVAPLTKDDR